MRKFLLLVALLLAGPALADKVINGATTYPEPLFDIKGATVNFPWAPTIHGVGGLGGTNTGHHVMWADQNTDITGADHFGLQTTDASLLAYLNLSGTPTTGGQFGLAITMNGVAYTIKYTTQASDTTMAALTAGLLTCLPQHGVNPGPRCTIAPATFVDDLYALGYLLTASIDPAGVNQIDMDIPGGITTVFTGINSATTTVTTGSLANFNLDSGSGFFYASRAVAGRTPLAGDPAGRYAGYGASTAGSGVDTQYGAVQMRVGVQSPTAPLGVISLETPAAEQSNKASIPRFSCRQGCWVETQGTGTPDQSRDPGYGGVNIGNGTGANLVLSSATSPQLAVVASGASDVIAAISAPAGQNVGLQFISGSTQKFQIYKDAGDNFVIYDSAHGIGAVTINNTGNVTVGEAGKFLTLAGKVFISPAGSGSTITGSVCMAGSGEVIYKGGANCF